MLRYIESDFKSHVASELTLGYRGKMIIMRRQVK